MGGPGCDVHRGSLLGLLLFLPLVETRRLEEAGGTGAPSIGPGFCLGVENGVYFTMTTLYLPTAGVMKTPCFHLH